MMKVALNQSLLEDPRTKFSEHQVTEIVGFVFGGPALAENQV